jgi:RNA polymerase sigma-70 factor, ECF subfamily
MIGMVTQSDFDLAQRAQRGDINAYGEMVRRYQKVVFNTCYRLLGERREAEDLTQEAFIHAYQRLQLYDPQRPFGPWIRRVAANLCLNRMQIKFPVLLPLDEETEQAASAEDVVEEQERTALAQRVWTALCELPAHYRAVIEMRHYQDLSYAEIAEILHLPLSDVKSHLFRARKLLAEKLKVDEPA